MNLIQKLKAKRYGVRIQSLATIANESQLILEEFSRLGKVRIKAPGGNRPLKVGAYSYVRDGSEIHFLEEIGRFCSIGRGVILGQAPDNHPIDWVSTSMSVSKDYTPKNEYSKIGHDVWIAHDAVIMAGVSIGTGAVIGRNAVVTKDVKPYDIVAGNPAKIIRSRFEDAQVEALIDSRWWELSMAELRKLKFDNIQQFLDQMPGSLSPVTYRRVSVLNRKVTYDADIF